MTTQGEQNKRVVTSLRHIRRGRDELDDRRTPPTGLLTTPLIGQLPRRDPDQPRVRPIRHPIRRPPRRRREQSLLRGVLRRLEVPVPPHQGGEDPRREATQQVLQPGHISCPAMSMIGRTSTAANRASGNRDASSSARAALSQSNTKYPASCSFASRYGPSVTTGTPSRPR